MFHASMPDPAVCRLKPCKACPVHWPTRANMATNEHPSRKPAMQKITAYILTYNEAAKIEAAISSVLWADDILVVDSNSTDRTTEMAQALGARVVQIPFEGFGPLRNRAIE